MDVNDRLQQVAIVMVAVSVLGLFFTNMLEGSSQPIPKSGYCHYESPVVAVGCTNGHCLVCTDDHVCRWMDWYTTCGQSNLRGVKDQ